jgi:hypothetical protein
MIDKCIESWKKFSSYIPLSFFIKDSLEKIIKILPNNISVADIGGGNPKNPQSSSYLLNQILEKNKKKYSIDVYDLNGKQPNNERIYFINGAVQQSFKKISKYDFALSVNALQTPSIPYNFSKKIHTSLKPESYLLMLLPKKESKEKELFQEIEAIIKEYPKGKIERRYNKSNLNYYFPKKMWYIENVFEHKFCAPMDKKILDYYFINPNIKEKVKKFTLNFNATENKNIYIKKKLIEYFNLEKDAVFEHIILESKFLEIHAKRI